MIFHISSGTTNLGSIFAFLILHIWKWIHVLIKVFVFKPYNLKRFFKRIEHLFCRKINCFILAFPHTHTHTHTQSKEVSSLYSGIVSLHSFPAQKEVTQSWLIPCDRLHYPNVAMTIPSMLHALLQHNLAMPLCKAGV